MNDENSSGMKQTTGYETVRLIDELQGCEDSPTTINFDGKTPSEDLTDSASVDLRKIRQAAYGKLLQAVPIPILFVDDAYKVCYANGATARLASRYDDIIGYSFPDLFVEEGDAERARNVLEGLFERSDIKAIEGLMQIGGVRIWGRVHFRAVRLMERKLALAIVEDLTAQKKRVLLNNKYRMLVNLLPIGIAEFSLTKPIPADLPLEEAIWWILEARAVDGNPEFARIQGYSRVTEMMGIKLRDIFPYEGRNRTLYDGWIRDGFPIRSVETRHMGNQGVVRHLEKTLIGIQSEGRLLGLWLGIRDVTERQSLRDEVLRAQKLESLGVLAGGIAHDFNNILTAILGNISLARGDASLCEETSQRLMAAERGAWRAKGLTSQLLTFSRGGMPVKKVIPLEPLLRESAAFALMGSNVGLEFSIAEDLWPVEADEGQIGQVVNNIVINATQAMPEGGRVSVSATNRMVDKDAGVPLSPGRYVKVSIADTGTGIPEGYLPRIFDPYFTTKQRGSGLGLATSYSIIKKHGGFIGAESRPEEGATIHFYLPASSTPALTTSPRKTSTARGTGRILVMDDDDMVRSVAEQMLRHMGFDVELAKNGKEAVDLYTRAMKIGERFDAVIMDLTVVGAEGGVEAVKKLLEVDPETKAIVSSGYCTDPVMSRYKDYGFVGVVSKPYDSVELCRAVTEVLSE